MRKALMLLCSLALLVVFAPPASAEDVYVSSHLTFSGPFSLPGITLPAGTYLFRFPSRDNAPGVIQVLSENRQIVYAMMMTIPTRRPEASGKHEITFKEARADAPLAIQAWFLPDRSIGYEFLYPKRSTKLVGMTAMR